MLRAKGTSPTSYVVPPSPSLLNYILLQLDLLPTLPYVAQGRRN